MRTGQQKGSFSMHFLAFHLQIDAHPEPDPDPVYLFDADADPDPAYHVHSDANPDPYPTFQFDEHPCGSGSIILTTSI
jgi:hypothetical protein